jgi:4-carboxymuconolactone decarboxylase
MRRTRTIGDHDGVMEPHDAPRLPVITDSDDPRLAESFARGLRGPDGEVLNIFGTLAHHPDLLRRWLVFATHVLSKSTLTPRDRELLILRTGWNCRSRYEWGQHVLIARDCGITDDEIERVTAGPGAVGWSPGDRVLLTAADELNAHSSLSDATWDALTERYSTEQVLDLIATVGNYHLVAMFLNATRVALDAGVPDVEMPPADGG